jgi:hypothetical protein
MGKVETVLSPICDSRHWQTGDSHSNIKVTTGVLRAGLSTTINPARSRSRNARRLVSRVTPSLASLPLGSGKVSRLAFQAA